MLGDVGGGAAVFAPEGEALGQAQEDEDHGGPEADRRVGRQEADQGGGEAHHDDRDEEGVLAPDLVADAAEDEGAEGPHGKAHADQGEAGQERRRVIAGGKEELPEKDRERGVDVKIVPFEDGAKGGGGDDEAMFLIEGGGVDMGGSG